MLRGLTALMAGAFLLCTGSTAAADVQGVWARDGGNSVTVGVESQPWTGASAGPAQPATNSVGHAPDCAIVPMPDYGKIAGPGGPGPGEWVGIECGGKLPLMGPGMAGLFQWVPVGAVPNNPVPVSRGAVAQQAEASIRLPGMNVGFDPARDGWVNFPEWLWLDNGQWHPFTATATVAGVSATATATPSYVTWQPGDGGTLRCDGPGAAYDPSRSADSQHSDCTWTYRTDSADQPGGVYTVTATVHWTVSWAGAGTGGVLPGLTTTVTAPLAVGQIESVNNS